MAQSNQLHFILFLVTIYILGAQSVIFTFKNNCPYTVWPGTLNNFGKPRLSTTGFELASGATFSVGAPSGWAGRFWGRRGCGRDGSGRFSCVTGDCGSGQVACNGAGGNPPATLAELALNGDGGKDFYDISLVDGFNLPMALNPIGGCASTTCRANVNLVCPNELAARNANGGVIGCRSACAALNRPEYCCTGAFNSPNTCKPTSYSRIFKGQCPQAYSYAFDDPTSTFTCPTGRDYRITFCPA